MANLANIAMLAELDGAILVDKPVGISAHDERQMNILRDLPAESLIKQIVFGST